MESQINDRLTTKVSAVQGGLSFAQFKNSRVDLHTPQPQMRAPLKPETELFGIGSPNDQSERWTKMCSDLTPRVLVSLREMNTKKYEKLLIRRARFHGAILRTLSTSVMRFARSIFSPFLLLEYRFTYPM